MATKVPMPGPVYSKEYFSVKVKIDPVSRDESTEEVTNGITSIDISRNGDLLLYGSKNYPTCGYTAGAWIKFEVLPERMYEKEG